LQIKRPRIIAPAFYIISNKFVYKFFIENPVFEKEMLFLPSVVIIIINAINYYLHYY